jgi:hypothetical protein
LAATPADGALGRHQVVGCQFVADATWFGPTAPKGRDANWMQTVPGKGWNVLPRLHGPEQSWFDKTRKPGEFELVR